MPPGVGVVALYPGIAHTLRLLAVAVPFLLVAACLIIAVTSAAGPAAAPVARFTCALDVVIGVAGASPLWANPVFGLNWCHIWSVLALIALSMLVLISIVEPVRALRPRARRA